MALEARGTREVACTTHELNALNSRLKDAANDCMLLTEQVVHGANGRQSWDCSDVCDIMARCGDFS